MGLELYLDLMSQPCRAVYIFAKKNNIPFQLRTIDLLKGQHYTDDFAQVNPLRKVPALKDGDFVLAERADPNWRHGISVWKPQWGRTSSRRPMRFL
uniref:glutathione transferase n=1 Tax=Peromyscus maniculatus bairdii TaxID=230844 RepID=A0A8C8W8R2_PERMB